MFGLEILDIALGLVLTYLLMSLILTAVREAIEAAMKSRAGDLEQAVTELLQGDSDLVARFYDHPLIYALHRGHRGGVAQTPPGNNAAVSPAMRTTSGFGRRELPSYIPRETFAVAVLDLLESGGPANPQLRQAYEGLKRVSGGRVQQVRTEIEGWFDAAMDRASGWYKRRTQVILFWLSLAVAILLNVNSVTIGHHLATDAQARVYADQLASKIVEQGEPTSMSGNKAFREQLDQLRMPVGWNRAALDGVAASFPKRPRPGQDGTQLNEVAYVAAWLAALLTLLVGYLITAFALMLGAPFWFDVLNRIMVIRSTVKPTEKSPDEPSEEGGQPRPKSPAAAPAGGAGAIGSAGYAPDLAADPDGGFPDVEGDLDGCLDGVKVQAIAATDDVELPPATGGVER